MALCGCSVDRREIDRSSSPDHRLLAIHIEAMGGGAAGFVAEEIYLNEQSGPTDLKHPILNASHCDVRTVAAMIAPCSVKTFGRYLRCWPRPAFKVAMCDLKELVSSAVS